jgi:hypothetical protein
VDGHLHHFDVTHCDDHGRLEVAATVAAHR